MLRQVVEGRDNVYLGAANLSKRFGRRVLFRGLSFSLKDGSTLAVTGANGSGKSTLLRILGGVLTPTEGTVHMRINGSALREDRHPLHAGLVAPYLNVYEGFSPKENLDFVAKARRLERAEARINEILDLVSLRDRASDPVSTFSSGMKQRVKFAVALLSNPPLLLLDEPRVSLDAAGLEMVRRVAEIQRGRGGLLVVATNDPNEADLYDEVIRIEDYR